MESDKKQYHFINNQTGNKIAYLSIPADTQLDTLNEMLDKRRKELATEHGIFFETIYWEEEII